MAGKFIDIKGKKFNRLTVIEKSHVAHKTVYWKCICDCGKTKIVNGVALRKNKTKSCGCINAPKGEEAIQRLKKILEKKSKINLETGCLEWIGRNIKHFGYGAVGFKGKQLRTHRASWLIYRGEIPKGKLVCHKCDNPKCINVDHLFLGSYKENMEDMLKKRRGVFVNGERQGLCKLNEKQVVEIRNKRASGILYKELAKEYGVAQNCIFSIVHRKTWKHIP